MIRSLSIPLFYSSSIFLILAGIALVLKGTYMCLRKKILTEDETKRISKRSLAPDQALGVNCFGGTIDITPTDPGRRHGENSNKKSDGTTGQHNLLLGVVAGLLFSGGPYSNTQNQDVE